MADLSSLVGISRDARPAETPEPLDSNVESIEKLNKEKKKLRSAWISFVSRIIAQFVGSAATIVLGVVVLQQYQTSSHDNGSPADELRSAPIRERRSSEQPALAVLPFDNFSGDPRQDHVSNAVTEGVITALSQLHGLRVISRTSSMQYKGAAKPLPEIAHELAVDWIVEGSVTSSNGRVHVTSQLIDATTDEHVWASSYERPLQDVVSLQTGLANLVAREVGAAIARDRASREDDGRLLSTTTATDIDASEAAPAWAQDGDSQGTSGRP